jgi:predicted metalloprotease with PDZ domain
MPFIRGRGTWLMEGAATYVEPIIRARAGWKTEEQVWHEWVDNMPQGVEAFSQGLATASGRQNYWGGATFMLLADIAIRRASNGAKGLDDCLGGVLWIGLDGAQRASIADYAAACDRATGTTAMSTLVDRHFTKAEPVDLAALWKELGISVVGGRIVVDDSAPSAQWRKLIVPGSHPPKRVKLPWES